MMKGDEAIIKSDTTETFLSNRKEIIGLEQSRNPEGSMYVWRRVFQSRRG